PCILYLSTHANLDHQDLHSSPTRRSSDLVTIASAAGLRTGSSENTSHPIGTRSTRSWAARRCGAPKTSKPTPSCSKAGRPCSNRDRKSTRLNSSHEWISYAVFCLKKKKKI